MLGKYVRNREVLEICFIFLFFIAVLVSFSLYGPSRRVYLKSPEVINITKPYRAYPVWASRGVKGRALVLFDRKLNAEPETSSLSKDNYIYLAIRSNLVRRVYHVLPDSSWPEVSKTLITWPQVKFSGGVFYTTIEGTPLSIMSLKTFQHIREKEKVLVNINRESYEEHEIRRIMDMINTEALKSDLTTISGYQRTGPEKIR